MNINISNLTFSATIPKTKLQIQKRDTKEFIPAIFYEVDGKDRYDFLEFQLGNNWDFGSILAKSTQNNHPFEHHYKIKTIYGETVAICRTCDLYDKAYDVEYLESKPNSNYKFAGRAILACIAKEILNQNGNTIKVLDPLASAYSFYEDACKFNCKGKYPQMNKKEMQDFISRTQEDIECKFIDITG